MSNFASKVATIGKTEPRGIALWNVFAQSETDTFAETASPSCLNPIKNLSIPTSFFIFAVCSESFFSKSASESPDSF